MRTALIVIGRFKPAWNELTEEEQAAFVTQVGRTARAAGVMPVVGYKLTTPGSFVEIWEADDKETIAAFIGALDSIGYKKYYGEVLMLGERSGNWIAPGAVASTKQDEPKRSGTDKAATPAAKKAEPRRKG